MTAGQIDTTIYNQAVSLGIPASVAKIMVAQARYESADYTSNLSAFNNVFGYKYVPGAKWQAGSAFLSPEGNYYAAYNSVNDSTGEIVDWLKRRQSEGYFNIADLTTPAAYADGIKTADYYGQSALDYANGLIAKYGLIKVGIVSVGTVLLVAAAIYFITKHKKAA